MRAINNNDKALTDDIHWKMTPGIGDVQWALNTAHRTAHVLGRPVKLTCHWYEDPNKLHHFEDPETIMERLYYLHDYYYNQDWVNVVHQYPGDPDIYHQRNTGTFHGTGNAITNSWMFRDDVSLPVDEKKFVYFSAAHNAEQPRDWKLLIDRYEWDDVVSNLELAGFEPVELTYRTPISEVMYHINTCRFVICYDGMWHYIAKNFWKPLIVVSRSAITKFNTPHALMLDETDIMHYTKTFNEVKKRQIIFNKHRTDRQTFRLKKTWDSHPNWFRQVSGLDQLTSRAKWYKREFLKLTFPGDEIK